MTSHARHDPGRRQAGAARGPGRGARVLAWTLGVVWLVFAGRQVVPTVAEGVPPPPPAVLGLAALALAAGLLCVFGAVRAGVAFGAVALVGLALRVSGALGAPAGPVGAFVTLGPDATAGALALLAGAHALALALAWPLRRGAGEP